jgi:hypothetical protein
MLQLVEVTIAESAWPHRGRVHPAVQERAQTKSADKPFLYALRGFNRRADSYRPAADGPPGGAQVEVDGYHGRADLAHVTKFRARRKIAQR